VESVERTSSVLLAFAGGEPALGVSQIARQLNLPKSAVHRTLSSLCRTGLIRRDPKLARYRLGPMAVELGLAALGHSDVRTAALPIMQELTARTRETTTLSLLAGRERFYAAQVESPQQVRMTIEIGRRCPLYAGASGRAILAFEEPAELDAFLEQTPLAALTESTITDAGRLRIELERVRSLGYAASSGERDAWAAAVAAPIRAPGGRVIGSISVCGPRGRLGENEVSSVGAAVKVAAARLSCELGGGALARQEET
jgi:DNA-binding IclR family transcriptional regulator